MTLEQLLKEARKDIYSETSLALKRKISTRLNTSHCYILHRVCMGMEINGDEFQCSRTILINKGYIDWHLTGKRGKNHKFLRAYRPTTMGIVAHGEMLDQFMPIVKRIIKKLKEPKTTNVSDAP